MHACNKSFWCLYVVCTHSSIFVVPSFILLVLAEMVVSSVRAQQWTIISEDFPNLGCTCGWSEMAWWQLLTPIHSSYEDYQALCIWWWGVWEPFNVGLEPQPLHNGVVCSPAVNQNFCWLPFMLTSMFIEIGLARRQQWLPKWRPLSSATANYIWIS